MGLLAWYKLDGDTTDSSGNGYNGTASNLTYSSSKICQGGSFNGTSSYFYHSNPGIANKNYFSISFWMYPTIANDAKILTPASAGFDQCVKYTSNKSISIDIAEAEDLNNRTISTTNDSVPLNTWSHIAICMNDLNIKVYINGVLDLNSTQVIPIAAWLDTWYWGVRGTVYTGYYTGLLDDIKIYNEILSQKEIKELSRAKVLHYDFDDFQEPTENLFTGERVAWGTVTTVGEWEQVTFNGVGDGIRNLVTLSKLTNGLGYTSSVEVYNPGSSNVTINLDWCDVSVSNFVITPGEAVKTISKYSVRATYDSTFRFFDICGTAGASIYFRKIQIEQKDHATPFVNDSRTGVVRDISGYGNDATLSLVTPQWTSSVNKIGKASYYFDGADAIAVPDSQIFDNLSVFTLSAWVKTSDATTDYNHILSKGETGATVSMQYILYITSGIARVLIGNGTTSSSTNIGIVNNDVWHLVTGTYDGTYLKGYLDGVLTNTITPAITPLSNNKKVVLGSNGVTTPGETLTGYIDDVRIYATALDSADILELYQTRAQIDKDGNMFANNFEEDPVSDGLVGWLPLSGDSYDNSGYENDGIVSGATLTTGITGEANTAYYFDGVDDSIQSANTDVALGQTYSLAWWQSPIYVAAERHPISLSSGSNQIYHTAGDNSLKWFTNSASCNSPTNDSDNTWVHYVLTSDSSSGRVIYRNGISVATSATPSMSLTSASLLLGNRIGGGYPWKGKINDVRVYNRVLSQDEITLLYNLGLGLV